MRKQFLILLIFTMAFLCAKAQDYSDKELSFVYISHDVNTPIQTLCDRLELIYRDAIDYPDMRVAIFYLANTDSPIIVKINTPDDNRKDFSQIIYELQHKRAHDVEPRTDIKEIISLFDNIDFLSEDGKKRFNNIIWCYYINSTFWELGNNEMVIANLFYIMGMADMIDSRYFKLNIFHWEDDPLPCDENLMFGSKYQKILPKYYSLIPY